MGSNRWNHSGCCGQCAGCNNCGQTGCDTNADCCDSCGLNTSALEIAAAGNGSGQNGSCGCGHCSKCCNTGCDTDADCCDTCGLTINPDGTHIASSNGDNRQRRYIRTAGCSGGNRVRRNYVVRSNSCNDCDSPYTNRSRNNDCNDCDECGNTYTNRSRNGDCDACNECNSTYTNRSRSGDCDDCNECNSTYTNRSRNGDCDDCNECSGTYANRSRNRGRVTRESGCCGDCGQVTRNSGCSGKCHSASVFHEEQVLNETFETEKALFQGTLFPELAKPLAAVADCATENCATRRQLEAFEAWELRLYLNMHPDDQCALARWKKLCCDACEDNYATAFTGDCDHGDCWQWVESPWPWEGQGCGGKKNRNK